MEPFRAFVADKLPQEQHGTGFAMQSFFIGVGAVVAGMLPYILKNWFHVSSATSVGHAIPPNGKISFYVGAAAFFCAVVWTILTTKEYPPEDLAAFRRKKSQGGGRAHLLREIPDALAKMPGTMKRLALVQFFTWRGCSACGCLSRTPCRSCSAAAIQTLICSNRARSGRGFVMP